MSTWRYERKSELTTTTKIIVRSVANGSGPFGWLMGRGVDWIGLNWSGVNAKRAEEGIVLLQHYSQNKIKQKKVGQGQGKRARKGKGTISVDNRK